MLETRKFVRNFRKKLCTQLSLNIGILQLIYAKRFPFVCQMGHRKTPKPYDPAGHWRCIESGSNSVKCATGHDSTSDQVLHAAKVTGRKNNKTTFATITKSCRKFFGRLFRKCPCSNKRNVKIIPNSNEKESAYILKPFSGYPTGDSSCRETTLEETVPVAIVESGTDDFSCLETGLNETVPVAAEESGTDDSTCSETAETALEETVPVAIEENHVETVEIPEARNEDLNCLVSNVASNFKSSDPNMTDWMRASRRGSINTGKPVSVNNMYEANRLVDNVLKFMASKQKFISELLPDMTFEFNIETIDNVYKGMISLQKGKIHGIGYNSHRHGRSTFVQKRGTNFIRASVQLMLINPLYENVRIQSLQSRTPVPLRQTSFPSLQGLFKDNGGFTTFSINGQGVLSLQDLEVDMYQELDFEFYSKSQHYSHYDVDEALVGSVMPRLKEAANNALIKNLKHADENDDDEKDDTTTESNQDHASVSEHASPTRGPTSDATFSYIAQVVEKSMNSVSINSGMISLRDKVSDPVSDVSVEKNQYVGLCLEKEHSSVQYQHEENHVETVEIPEARNEDLNCLVSNVSSKSSDPNMTDWMRVSRRGPINSGKPVSVNNMYEANRLVDNVLKFVASKRKFHSELLPDMTLKCNVYQGMISLQKGRIHGIGYNPHRHGMSTVVQKRGTTFIRASVDLTLIKARYEKVRIHSLQNRTRFPSFRSFEGLFKVICGIITFSIDDQGVLVMQDLEVDMYKGLDFEFFSKNQHYSHFDLNEALVGSVMPRVKEAANNALIKNLKRASRAYQQQL